MSERLAWEKILGGVDFSQFTEEQQKELELGREANLPYQLYASPYLAPEEMREFRNLLPKMAFVKEHASGIKEPSPEELGPGFRSEYIFKIYPDQICYIPEHWDFEEDGPGYTGKDILALCDNDPLKAEMVFARCEWQDPSTILEEWDEDDDRSLAEVHAKYDLKSAHKPLAEVLSAVKERAESQGTISPVQAPVQEH